MNSVEDHDDIPELLADLRGAVAARVRGDTHGERMLTRRLVCSPDAELAALVRSCINGDLVALARRRAADTTTPTVTVTGLAATLVDTADDDVAELVPVARDRPAELVEAAVEALSALCVAIAHCDGNAPEDRARWICLGTGLAR